MRYVIFFCLALFLFNCSHNNFRGPSSTPDVVSKFETRDDFKKLQTNQHQQEFVKFVIETSQPKWKLNFFNSKKFNLHTGFVKNYLKSPLSAEEIYKQARINNGRQYIFGALIRGSSGPSGSLYHVQFTSQDILSVDNIIKMFNLIGPSIGFPHTLRYKPSGNQMSYAVTHDIKTKLNLNGIEIGIPSKELTKFYATGFTVGILKIVSAADIENKVYNPSPNDILVLDYVPDSLPPVRGVITGTPSSPNSHVSLLTDMLSIPFIYSARAHHNSVFKELKNQKVFFKPYEHSTLQTNPFTLMAINDQVYEKFDRILKNRFPRVELKPDSTVINSYKEFPALGTKDSHLKNNLCGAKVTNSNFIRNSLEEKYGQELGKQFSLDGFCIPFFYFSKFLEDNKTGNVSLRSIILKKIKDLGSNPKIEDIHTVTNEIQDIIQKASIDKEHLILIKKQVLSHFVNAPEVKKVRFRSSSNAEDDKRFNGAGLYESAGVKIKHFKNGNLKKIEEALKTVWSSLYSFKAYLARRQFNIDEDKVFMGILVNQAFDEDARGVALCKTFLGDISCLSEGFPGGEYKVTHPPQGKKSEIASLKEGRYTISQHTSELPQFSGIFSQNEADRLFEIMSTLYQKWATTQNPGFQGELDFEWKRMKRTDGSTYMLVKQIREVPSLDVSGFKEPIFMVSRFDTMRSAIGDNEYGPLGHSQFASYQFSIPPMMSFKSFNQSQVKIKSSDFLAKDRNLNIKKIISNKESPWSKMYKSGMQSKAFEVFLETDHEYYNDLNLKLSYESKKQNGKLVSDNIITIDQLEASAWVHKKHYPYWKNPDTSILEGDFITSRLTNKKAIRSKLKRQYQFCYKGNVAVIADIEEASTSHIPEDGTYPLVSLSLKAKGLPTKIKKDFIISGPKATYGHGDSHAEDYEYLVSYQYSGYITKEQQQSLGLNKARFFVISKYNDFENPRILYSTFDIDMNHLRTEKMDWECP